ncbi:MAG TPA: DUF2624 family protein [Tenericutes bacterium]|nr:DUF2624 family protein [Mycoplasmatota bacterium]
MYQNLIKDYVKKLTVQDINNFCNKKNITLKEGEAEIIYKYIKKDWEKLLSGSYMEVFLDVKDKVSKSTYEKLIYYYKRYIKK